MSESAVWEASKIPSRFDESQRRRVGCAGELRGEPLPGRIIRRHEHGVVAGVRPRQVPRVRPVGDHRTGAVDGHVFGELEVRVQARLHRNFVARDRPVVVRDAEATIGAWRGRARVCGVPGASPALEPSSRDCDPSPPPEPLSLDRIAPSDPTTAPSGRIVAPESVSCPRRERTCRSTRTRRRRSRSRPSIPACCWSRPTAPRPLSRPRCRRYDEA